ncbi:tRNA pseudouridine(38-40) synthase TruA [Alkalihalophilus lindianensis]|uniref:tRNA pseudouridine synthase A n=1 Tax=Alkalihalophilus lindianensis TaxID=1630542 RepID=A0ABU3XFJ7_9BACI|nr:tRNA pseudouridine(38-40) synthase TruA [Alkalihalophilus lindianensis]MDV2686661.1 tRNA pseudouridine(38-40) synthase TruA [Alkalihalophilus lindianensis]
MKRLACVVSYDGTNFSGYQVQPNKRTVQLELEKALKKVHKGQKTHVVASGRTDAGVHARGQVIHFDSPYHIPEAQWPKALNACLPDDIRITRAKYVSTDFHARYHTSGKEYRYRVLKSEQVDVFRRNLVTHIPYSLDVEEMRVAAQLIVGTHDFSAFCAANTNVVDKVRTLYAIEIEEYGDELHFILRGNGFLYNMVRIIVGTLLEVGNKKRSVNSVRMALEKCEREYAGKTAPGHGLYLWAVQYDEQ